MVYLSMFLHPSNITKTKIVALLSNFLSALELSKIIPKRFVLQVRPLPFPLSPTSLRTNINTLLRQAASTTPSTVAQPQSP